jgi:hypothetical protein
MYQGALVSAPVLATLTATMGDAAFLLLAKEPLTGFFIIGLGFGVGVITGYIVDALHGPDFMRPKNAPIDSHPDLSDPEHDDFSNPVIDKVWMLIFAPGLILGLMLAFQIDVDALLGTENLPAPASLLGFIGGMLCFGMWALPRLLPQLRRKHTEIGGAENETIIRRTIADTNFVTSWVIFAFLLFEVAIHLTGIDLKSFFTSVAAFAPSHCGTDWLYSRMRGTNTGHNLISVWLSAAISTDRQCD